MEFHILCEVSKKKPRHSPGPAGTASATNFPSPRSCGEQCLSQQGNAEGKFQKPKDKERAGGQTVAPALPP